MRENLQAFEGLAKLPTNFLVDDEQDMERAKGIEPSYAAWETRRIQVKCLETKS
jgi:hypothetical protein